jgi:DNA ligase D-like protein (predicted 3'-phosphoesterase)
MATKRKSKSKPKGAGSLAEYERKRDFSKTSEPSGKKPKRGAKRRHPRFTIQKHDATSLHYDLRLEVNGVLASWAVPKGPSTDPADKRLAMRTEDHPMDYIEFEGVIPKGEYGAGPVIVWDRGVFENISEKRGEPMDLAKAIEVGDVKVFLLGEKIRGPYALVRTRTDDRGREQWLLIKKRGEGADRRRNPTSSQPKSVLTGRTIAQVLKEEG